MRCLEEYAHEAMLNALRPIYQELQGLRKQLDRMEEQNRELIFENAQLRHYHEKSGLDRDKPMNCRYKLRKITSGQFTGQTDTYWYCPVCCAHVSNWEHYCVSCGQKLERQYLPELEMKDDDNPAND